MENDGERWSRRTATLPFHRSGEDQPHHAAMSHRHLYLAAYDISDDTLRVGALQKLRGVATGGQKSVHEVWLTEAERRRVLEDMTFFLEEEDRFLLLRLDVRSATQVIGRGQKPADPDFFYIG